MVSERNRRKKDPNHIKTYDQFVTGIMRLVPHSINSHHDLADERITLSISQGKEGDSGIRQLGEGSHSQ